MRPPVLLSKDTLQKLSVDVLIASGSSYEDAMAVTETLLWADLAGRFQQGVFRLPVLYNMLRHGIITSPTEMIFTERTPAAAHLDAGNGFGQIAGVRAIEKGIQLARKMGIGMVTVNRSNHFGALSYYCKLAAEAQCMGLIFTNATPKVAPHGGTKAVFGTNPIAFGCPTTDFPILVDFATASIAGSTIRNLTEAGGKLPDGVALDKDGKPTNDPAAIASGSLLPAAGPKGYGLGLMIEILCGILAGAGMSHEVGPFYSTWERKVNSGHLFIVIDITRHQPIKLYFERMNGLIAEIKSSPLQENIDEILLPGEIRNRFTESHLRNGIPLNEETITGLEALAQKLNLKVPWERSASPA